MLILSFRRRPKAAPKGLKKSSDSTLQADAEDSCNNETESPNVPEDPKKKIIQRMNLKQLKNPNPQILN